MDELDKMAQEARDQAAFVDQAGNQVVNMTPEQRERLEARAYAKVCQKIAEAYKAEVLATGKPSVMVFQATTDSSRTTAGEVEGTEGKEVFAGVLLHVCVAGKPKDALELLARTLHQRVRAEARAGTSEPEDPQTENDDG
jgi:hypothetical protein